MLPNNPIMVIHNTDSTLLSEVDTSTIVKLSGFTGSSGSCIFLPKGGGIFITDNRYELQIEQQLKPGWHGLIGNKLFPKEAFLKLQEMGIKSLQIVGETICLADFEKIKTFLATMNIQVTIIEGLKIFPQAVKKASQTINLPFSATGETSHDRIAKIISLCKPQIPIITLDGGLIGWFSLKRNANNEENLYPSLGGLILPNGQYFCFTNKEEMLKLLTSQEVNTILTDYDHITASAFNTLSSNDVIINKINLQPALLAMCIKTKTEIINTKKSHILDGVALVKFFAWLDFQINLGNYPSEKQAASQLEIFRRMVGGKLYRCPSFNTISGFGSNGAIVHYSTPSEKILLKPNNLYLCDSGGHYYYGTTDITRTINIGKPTPQQKSRFTAVLKGHIAVATAVFTKTTPASSLDFLARNELLKQGLNYEHSTGHGVGYMSSVHEGIVTIGSLCNLPIASGMLLSNEPGLYIKNQFGIRIENLVIAKPYKKTNLLHFETISLAPIDKKLIVAKQLTSSELNWINNYHENVYNTLEKHLSQIERSWLKIATMPLYKKIKLK